MQVLPPPQSNLSPMSKRVLLIIAHPDDEMHIAGTLALQAAAGIEVTIAVASSGNLGGAPELTKEDRAAVRRLEMQESCATLGARLEWLGYGDDNLTGEYYGNNPAMEAAIRSVLRRVDPDLILIPALDDYHKHHRLVAEVALNASSNASNPTVITDDPPSSAIPTTLHLPPMPPGVFSADIYVDISSTFEKKMAALRCHKSQYEYLQSHHRTDIFQQIEAAAITHGVACGVQYAEVLSFCRRFNRPATIQRLAGFFPALKGAS